jgi:branched-chain amino acid transport system permease protein
VSATSAVAEGGNPLVAQGVTALRRAFVGKRAVVVVAAGGLLAVIGSFLPWATFSFGYPGSVDQAGTPGGFRAFVLLLGAIALLALATRRPGRRAAVLWAGAGAGALSIYNLIAIAKDGGGLGALAIGAWLGVVGGLLPIAGGAALPDDVPVPSETPVLPSVVESLIVAAIMGLGLELMAFGLKINESSRFISYVAFLGFAGIALARVGLASVIGAMLARRRGVYIASAALVAVVFPFTQNGNATWIRTFASVGVFATAAIGLNVVVGLAGLLDLGYVAFFGVGAYVGALLAHADRTTVHVHVPYMLVILLGAAVAGLFGVLIGAPTLRLRGDYLAIVTLGFGEIFRIVAFNWDSLTRGPNGISGIPDLALGHFSLGQPHTLFGVRLPYFANYYYAELILVAAMILAFTRLNDSRIGRAWVAIREDEVAAAAMGVNTVALKLLAFAIGAFIAGAAGTMNAHLNTAVNPDSYTFLESILLLAAVVLGGMGTIPGALIGSTLLVLLPEKLRFFQDKRLLIFGAALVLMMRFRPEGIAPSYRRRSELKEGGATAGASGLAPSAAAARSDP